MTQDKGKNLALNNKSKLNMKIETITIILILIAITIMSIAHQRDIYNKCIKQCDSGMSMCTEKIRCEPLTN